MAPRRHRGSDDSKTRALLVETTERVMLEEGYAAVTSRRVALDAGVTPPLVHYYFPTLDDLFLAVLRRRADEQLLRQARLFARNEPLRAMWRYHSDPKSARFLTELMALGNHRKSIQGEIAAVAARFRTIEIDALQEAVAEGRVDLGGIEPATVVTLLSVAAHGLVNEQDMGLTTGHRDVLPFVEELLARADETPGARGGATPARRAPRKGAEAKAAR